VAKTNYIAKLDGNIIGTRSSERTYTHAVIIQWSEESFRERDHSVAYAQQCNSKKNFEYYCGIAAHGIEGEMAQYKYTSLEEATRRVEHAKEIAALGYEGWVEQERMENIAEFEAKVARGGFTPAVLCWNGRRDLAEKEAAKYRGRADIANVWIVEAEAVAKLPKIKGERKHAAYGPHSK
jgi:hypothetical protein